MGGGCTDEDERPGEELARAFNGRRGIVGRAREDGVNRE